MPEVRRIAKHRHVPRIVKKAAEAERVQRDKERRKVSLSVTPRLLVPTPSWRFGLLHLS